MNKLTLTQCISRRWGLPGKGLRFLACLSAACALFILNSAPVFAADNSSDPKDNKEITPPPTTPDVLGSKISGLMQFEFSDKYYTPRGLMSSNSGVSFQPLVILFFDLYSSDKGPLNDLSFNLGVWNDVDSHANPSERNPGNWNELDGFFGVEAKVFKDWKLDATETFFRSMTQSYDTTTNFDFQATYLDHWFGDSGFSINPYGAIFYDTSKIPVVIGSPGSYYGTIGMDPTYKFKSIPLTVELPTFVNIVNDNFYNQTNGDPGGAGPAVISTELKFTAPLSFIPIAYGKWSAYFGVQYYHLDNLGLEQGNQILKSNPHTLDTDLYQLHWGMTCFF